MHLNQPPFLNGSQTFDVKQLSEASLFPSVCRSFCSCPSKITENLIRSRVINISIAQRTITLKSHALRQLMHHALIQVDANFRLRCRSLTQAQPVADSVDINHCTRYWNKLETKDDD
jgi:hypothetical protein